MHRSLGSWCKKMCRTHGAIPWWVEEERWWMLMAKTVITMERVTKIMVKTRYSPIRGITLEEEGIISSMTRRKTVRDTKTEVHSEIFSPPLEGR
ncbi:UNVERIFIED_CONTAM: hypothetical protein FKN15_006714 [Acipenser sinensis]